MRKDSNSHLKSFSRTMISIVLIVYPRPAWSNIGPLDAVARTATGIYVDAGNKGKSTTISYKSLLVSSFGRDHIDHVYNFNCHLIDLHMKALLVAFDAFSYDYVRNHFQHTTSATSTSSGNGSRQQEGQMTQMTLYPYLWNNGGSSSFVNYAAGSPSSAIPDIQRSYRYSMFYTEKLVVVLQLLELGYNVLYVDITTALRRDPLPHLPQDSRISLAYAAEIPCYKDIDRLEYLKRDDGAIEGSMGMYFVRRTDATVSLFRGALSFLLRGDTIYPGRHSFWDYVRTLPSGVYHSLPTCGKHHSNSNSQDLKVLEQAAVISDRMVVGCPLDECLFLIGDLRWNATTNVSAPGYLNKSDQDLRQAGYNKGTTGGPVLVQSRASWSTTTITHRGVNDSDSNHDNDEDNLKVHGYWLALQKQVSHISITDMQAGQRNSSTTTHTPRLSPTSCQLMRGEEEEQLLQTNNNHSIAQERRYSPTINSSSSGNSISSNSSSSSSSGNSSSGSSSRISGDHPAYYADVVAFQREIMKRMWNWTTLGTMARIRGDRNTTNMIINIETIVEMSIMHYRNNTFREVVGEHPVLVFPMICAGSSSFSSPTAASAAATATVVHDVFLGRCLQRYFHALAMTVEFGLHFIPIPIEIIELHASVSASVPASPTLSPASSTSTINAEDISHQESARRRNSTTDSSEEDELRRSFFGPLMATHKHSRPSLLSRLEVSRKLLALAKDPNFGSSSSSQIDWALSLPIIRERLHRSFESYIKYRGNSGNKDEFIEFSNPQRQEDTNQSSNHNKATPTELPIVVPNVITSSSLITSSDHVAIWFQCGISGTTTRFNVTPDVGNHSSSYSSTGTAGTGNHDLDDFGYLRFGTYPMVISHGVKNIRILTDPACGFTNDHLLVPFVINGDGTTTTKTTITQSTTASATASATTAAAAAGTANNDTSVSTTKSSNSTTSSLVPAASPSSTSTAAWPASAEDISGHLSLLHAMIGFLKKEFPLTTIAIPKLSQSSSPSSSISTRTSISSTLDALVQISSASLVVSPPSSLSFWAALANRDGEVFFSSSPKLFGGRSIFVSDKFRWMTFPRIDYLDAREYCTAPALPIAQTPLSTSSSSSSSSSSSLSTSSSSSSTTSSVAAVAAETAAAAAKEALKYAFDGLINRLQSFGPITKGKNGFDRLCAMLAKAAVPQIPIRSDLNSSYYENNHQPLDNVMRDTQFNASPPPDRSVGGIIARCKLTPCKTSQQQQGTGNSSSVVKTISCSRYGDDANQTFTATMEAGGAAGRRRQEVIDLQAMLNQLYFNVSLLNAHQRYNGNLLESVISANLDRLYSAATGTAPVFVYPLIVSEDSLGNYLGNLFQAVSMAQEVGLHFIAVPHRTIWRSNGTLPADHMPPLPFSGHSEHHLKHHLKHHNHHQHHPHKKETGDALFAAFAESLVITVEHANPSVGPVSEIITGLMRFTTSFPWESSHQPWTRNIDLIRYVMTTSLDRVAQLAYPQGVHASVLPLNCFRETRGVPPRPPSPPPAPSIATAYHRHRHLTEEEKSGSRSSAGSPTKNNTAASAMASVLEKLNKKESMFTTATSTSATTTSKKGKEKVAVAGAPFIPDVVVKIRCNDVLQFSSGDSYGLLSFHLYQMAIPPTAKTIYILAESQDRNKFQKQKGHDKPFDSSSVCNTILTALLEDLHTWFPNAFIGLIRGGNLVDSMIQMAYARTVITSASTLSLWAMLANENDSDNENDVNDNSHHHSRKQMLFPTTNLVIGGNSHYIADNFYWFSRPKQMGFGHDINFDDESNAATKVLVKLRDAPRRDALPQLTDDSALKPPPLSARSSAKIPTAGSQYFRGGSVPRGEASQEKLAELLHRPAAINNNNRLRNPGT